MPEWLEHKIDKELKKSRYNNWSKNRKNSYKYSIIQQYETHHTKRKKNIHASRRQRNRNK